jgi:transposase, IS5 family
MAAKPVDFTTVAIDTTVQEEVIAHPTGATLMRRAHARRVALAQREGIDLRQNYKRIGKHALIAHQRYAAQTSVRSLGDCYAKQFKRANRELKRLRTRLGRVRRDIARKIASK